ncbi:CoA transferase [Sphingobium sp. V4]|uniref:CaiB/BaiF CoA transferase family protein n=1 Tax=Sphingobium sp. V4 TaxID=3038927 RepID=UPI002557EAEB|nr:CoA transferase [Sphingobium sp. V4]WIW89453.1 CoA transferase [Sphingobium sp. V4]
MNEEATPVRVLSGVKVLDFGRFIAGPASAAFLGDLGADVIRIDKLGGGEDRGMTPVTAFGEGTMFLQNNRNKRSIEMDIASPEGRDVVRRMVQDADVVIANMPEGTLKSLGLDYESLRAINPRIIVSTSSAYGSGGPYSKRIGFDGVGQVMSGAVYRSGTPEQPVRAAVPYVDFSTALSGAMAVLAALLHRERTGEGQHVETCLIGTALMIASSFLIEQAALQVNRQATLNRGQLGAPVDMFRMKDGWLLIQVAGQPMYERWCKLIGEDSWRTDPRFATDVLRGEHGEIISARMQQWCDSRTKAEAIADLEAMKIPAYAVYSPQEALDDPHIQAMGFLQPVEYHGLEKPVPIAGPPFRMSATPPTIRRSPPASGEHTRQILGDFGYDEAEIERLHAAGVVRSAPVELRVTA